MADTRTPTENDAPDASTVVVAVPPAPRDAAPGTAGSVAVRPQDQRTVGGGPSGGPVADDIVIVPGRLERWWRGRFGLRMVREVVLVFVLLTLYRLGRYIGREQVDVAMSNAYEILRVERVLGIANEADLQRAALDHLWLIKGLNRYYVQVHFPATVGFLVFLYLRANDGYVYLRRLLVVTTAAGLVLHLAYPLAPPRMLAGFVDTISKYGPAIYQRSDVASAANQYAAMPSLHFGWAVIVAFGIVRVSRSRWRWLAVLHPAITLVAIVLTANHYWLDAVVAGALVLGALALVSPDPRVLWRWRRPSSPPSFAA